MFTVTFCYVYATLLAAVTPRGKNGIELCCITAAPIRAQESANQRAGKLAVVQRYRCFFLVYLILLCLQLHFVMFTVTFLRT